MTTIFVTHDQAEAMDVASQIAVMNHARIEQVGSPTELYDEPATEFVMQFVGEANRIGSAGCGRTTSTSPTTRCPSRGDGERVTHFGFEARVELAAADGDALLVQLTRDRLEELELEQGQIVWVRPARERFFDEEGAPLEGARPPRSEAAPPEDQASGCPRATRSASVVCSSTSRIAVRRSIQTPWSGAAVPT